MDREKSGEKRRGQRRKQSADHGGDGRRSVVRELETQKSYLKRMANTMGAAKPIHKVRNSAYGGRRAHSSSSSSSFSSSLSFLLPRRRGGTIGQTGCHNPLLFSHTLAVLCLCVSPCTFLVPVDERSFALSLLHPCQLMSHRVQRLRWPTFSVMFLSSACLPLPLSTIVLSRLPGWIDRWLELLR